MSTTAEIDVVNIQYIRMWRLNVKHDMFKTASVDILHLNVI